MIRDAAVVAKVFGDLAERYETRPGGYTRVLKSRVRVGDAAPLSIVELVDRSEPAEPKPEPKAPEKKAPEKKAAAEKKPKAAPAKKTPAKKAAANEGAGEEAAAKKSAAPKRPRKKAAD